MNTTEETPEVCLDAGTRRAKRQFEEVWSRPLAEKQNWQRIAFGQTAVILCLSYWLGHNGSLPKERLYVVERDKGGRVAYAGPVKPVDMDARTWDLVKVQALKRFLEAWRTVTTDRTAQQADWDRAFTFVGDGSQAKAALNTWFETNDPVKRAQSGELVSVRYKTFDVEGANTFGLWWEETTSIAGGQMVSTKEWRARIVYAMHIPSSEWAREENSLGVLITEISWEEVR